MKRSRKDEEGEILRHRQCDEGMHGEVPEVCDNDFSGEGEDGLQGGDTFRVAFEQLRAAASLDDAAARATEGSRSLGLSDDRDTFVVRSSGDIDGGDGMGPEVRLQCAQWGMDPQLGNNLRTRLGITHFFPLQAEGIERFLRGGDSDLCLSAPTGSGKTLVFALSVVAALAGRTVRRLRALVVLPTRELALQCHGVFDAICYRTGLAVVVSVGQQQQQKHDVSDALFSSCDILICTPGKLADLLKSSTAHPDNSFTLEHLSFLVIDEADRLLSQRYQDWLTQVYAAAFRGGTLSSSTARGDKGLRRESATAGGGFVLRAETRRRLAGSSVASHRFDEPPLRRILCSATLTRNPQKLAALRLRRPISIALRPLKPSSTTTKTKQLSHNVGGFLRKAEEVGDGEKFYLPESLLDHMLVCSRAQKPAALVQLLVSFKHEPTLVFASSVEATHRLAVFLRQYLGAGRVAELSSLQKQRERTKVIRRFARAPSPPDVLVVSDVMSRGIDLDNLMHVVSYDVPTYVKAFVHRVGRVARAGRKGSSYTLLRSDQVKAFRSMLARVPGRQAPTPVELDLEFVEAHTDKVHASLGKMKQLVQEEEAWRRRN